MSNTSKKQPQQSAAPSLPKLPLDELQSVMPFYVKESIRVFDDENQKATALLSTITVLSALYPNVHGIYHHRKFRPNIYSMVIAEAASGKGVMPCAEKLVLSIDNYLNETTPQPDEGKPTAEKMLIIPANISKAMLLKLLRDNWQTSLMIESEADTLKTALKGDFGSFTDVLRQLFHHETIRQGTIKNGTVRIPNAALSACLTGTPDQIGFIDNVKNGLFSRFLYYYLPDNFDWENVSPQGNKSLCYDDHFNALSGQLFIDWQFFQSRASFENPLMFELTIQQWDELNTRGRELTNYVKDLGIEGIELRPTVRRLMLIAYRIAMTLTVTNTIQGRQTAGRQLICPDDYFEAALNICDVCFDHASYAANNMMNREHKGRKPAETVTKMITAIEQAASPIFTKPQLVQIAAELGIKESNLNNKILPKLPLQKVAHGVYERNF